MEIQIDKNILIPGTTTKSIVSDCYYLKNKTQKKVVIFCHGYKGFKDWGAWDLMAKTFAESGFFFIKFNFSHNGGTSENPIDFPDLEAFANDNYTTQLNDLGSVINWAKTNQAIAEEINLNDINLIGHSRGGGIVLLKAYEDKSIKKVVTFAGVSDYASRFPKNDKLKQWQEEGVYYVENSRTHQQMPHYYQFYEDFIKNEQRLNIQKAVEQINIPLLIIHAKDDTSVKPLEAEKLHQWNHESELFYIKNGGHTFGAKHPWKSAKITIPLQKITRKTISFLKL